MRVRMKALVGAALVAGGLGPVVVAGVVSPARADGCQRLNAGIYWTSGGSTSLTPWPNDACVVPVPGWTAASNPDTGTNQGGLPQGTPSGFYLNGEIDTP